VDTIKKGERMISIEKFKLVAELTKKKEEFENVRDRLEKRELKFDILDTTTGFSLKIPSNVLLLFSGGKLRGRVLELIDTEIESINTELSKYISSSKG